MELMVSILMAVCFMGLAYVLISALSSGAEVYSGAYSTKTAREFEDLFVFVPPRRIAEAGWACAVAAFLTVFMLTGNMTSLPGFVTGFFLGAGAAAVALRLPRKAVGFLKKRRLTRFNEQLVDTLLSMSNALKAGFSISQAFENVAKAGDKPISQEFSLFLQQTRIGVSFSDALTNMERRVSSEDLTLVVSAIETARRTGGNLTEVLENISRTIRERMRIERRIRTLTAQGRLQGWIVGSMPVVIGIALWIIDPKTMVPFVHSTIGMVIIGVVVVLLAAGAKVIRKIITIDV
jgi:tight adherence protein B